MGDFNINLLNYDSHLETENFVNSLGSQNFHPQILKPTRITHHSATLIDNIFFNSLEHLVISGNVLSSITDHLPNFLIVNKLSNIPKNFKMFKRDYSKFDKNAFISDCQETDWQKVLYEYSDKSNVTVVFQNFYDHITKTINKYAPIRKLSKKEVKSLSKPWVTDGIKTSIKVKEKLYKRYIETRNPYHLTKYKYYRNKIICLLRKSKQNYYHNYFIQYNKNIKKMWAGIKELVTLKPKGFHFPTKITSNNTTLSDPCEIASAFNRHFAKIGSNLADKIPAVNTNPLSYLSTPLQNSFFLSPVTDKEIEDEINCLNASKSTGPFSIPVYILKLLKNCLSFPLQLIYNLSFSSGCVPDQFKLANVIPVHKKDSTTSLNNYRPISLLSIFNIIMEKLVHKRLITFINKHNLLYENQFGFREKHSTSHATLLIIDKIQQAIEDGQFSCGIFLDFSKAFDTVDHRILLQKLHYFGIRGVVNNWFTSYLLNRRQYVSIGSEKSEEVSISHGVPQGSVLGPLLFLLYINDFYKCSDILDFHIFADDTNLFYSDSNLRHLENTINSNLKQISCWLKANKLSLNIEKTNYVIFYPRQKKLNHTLELKIDNQRLEQKESIKYLGLYIDSHLNWKSHINHITKKIKRCIGILSKIRYFVSLQVLVQLYNTLILPFLTYSLITWGSTYQTSLEPLKILQKKALRIITFSNYCSHSTPLFHDLGMLKLDDLIFLNTALFMHDYHSNALPSAFINFFTCIKEVHQYNTRLASKHSYYIPKVRTNYGIFNIRYAGSKIWNSVQNDFKSKNRTSFKHYLKSFLLSKYVN